jgi:hypothetical protein
MSQPATGRSTPIHSESHERWQEEVVDALGFSVVSKAKAVCSWVIAFF